MSSNSVDRNASLLIPSGTALFLLGLGMLFWSLLIGSFSIYVCGWLIGASGLIVAGGALFGGHRELFWLNLFRGCLYTVLGFMIVSKPGAARDALGLLVSSVLLVEGIFEITPSIVLGFRNRIVRTVIGVYAMVMGALIWANWPGSVQRLIEVSLAVDMMLNGYALMTVGVFGTSTNRAELYSLLGKVESPSASDVAESDGLGANPTGSSGEPREKDG